MTIFRAMLDQLGLSPDEAACILGQSPITVRRKMQGVRNATNEDVKALRDLDPERRYRQASERRPGSRPRPPGPPRRLRDQWTRTAHLRRRGRLTFIDIDDMTEAAW